MDMPSAFSIAGLETPQPITSANVVEPLMVRSVLVAAGVAEVGVDAAAGADVVDGVVPGALAGAALGLGTLCASMYANCSLVSLRVRSTATADTGR